MAVSGTKKVVCQVSKGPFFRVNRLSRFLRGWFPHKLLSKREECFKMWKRVALLALKCGRGLNCLQLICAMVHLEDTTK